jgi:hypothetical protein
VADARDYVRGSDARFLFASCRPAADLEPILGPLLARTRRFGCATVYELRPRPDMARAAGAPDE